MGPKPEGGTGMTETPKTPAPKHPRDMTAPERAAGVRKIIRDHEAVINDAAMTRTLERLAQQKAARNG